MKLVASLGAILLVALLAAPAAAIDNGVPDRNRHPNVGLLAFDLDGPSGAPP